MYFTPTVLTAFYIDTYNFRWSCKDKDMGTDWFNMPDMIS